MRRTTAARVVRGIGALMLLLLRLLLRAVAVLRLRFGQRGEPALQPAQRLVRHAEQIRVDHELAPGARIGGKRLVERLQVAQPVAQRLAFGAQLVALDAAARHVVAQKDQPDHREGAERQRGVAAGRCPRGERDHRGDAREDERPHLPGAAHALDERLLFEPVGEQLLPGIHRLVELPGALLAELRHALERERVAAIGDQVE